MIKKILSVFSWVLLCIVGILLLFVTWFVWDSVSYVPDIKGVVRDGVTGEPVSGMPVILYAQYINGFPLDAIHRSYRVEEVVTDVHGLFHFERSFRFGLFAFDAGYAIAANLKTYISNLYSLPDLYVNSEYQYRLGNKQYFPTVVYGGPACAEQKDRSNFSRKGQFVNCTRVWSSPVLYLIPAAEDVKECSAMLTLALKELCGYLVNERKEWKGGKNSYDPFNME
ncbi:MAG TPA: hypothetical protein VJB56_02975 [Candidatus Paceibacterota bacterium]